ncbi:amino acid ABC transporter permease [Microbacterium aurantiacum]|uniref:Amino acid ABC transporter permease n=2 Tax=Microbacterium aurantiacum TaxID=162393 RepID=A0A0M9VLA0_9MICO|nr:MULTISPECIES: amino acid ABC transporter permease [Microbacterium]ODT10663.1 MAG: amino acid ABC transporter permease [Microbacterium sp. SCN 70-18]ANG85447.1 amino acid ABC transporter permease [Microbacterium chocolatum]KOS10935.1 amino acid ABC transporter permease [Microbacterium chocolatum]MBN9202520.1 amino acid ABC transporter permease [Microbacterium chocolatum]MDS0246718.1 amino acid ABC transporter permease [Microbacterium aurantiacum]
MEQYLSLWPTFWEGFRVTLLLLAVSGVLSLILGTIIAAMRISPIGSLRLFAAFWTEIARNTPLTLVFFFFAVVVPFLGVRVPYIPLAIAALAYYTSPFVAEALRSGINGVPVGQAEAARSIGLGFGQTVSLVVLPQAFRMTIPPLINVFIALTKNTSVAGGFFVVELFAATRALANGNGNMVILILLTAAALYLAVTIPLGLLAGQIERRVVVQR